MTKRSDIMHVEIKAFKVRINHFMQVFTITCKQTTGIVVVNTITFKDYDDYIVQECVIHPK